MPESGHPPKPNLSRTSLGTFEACPRKWALSYARDLFPKQFSNEIYLEYRLMDFGVLAGQLVDDVITDSIREYLATKQWSTGLYQKSREIAKEYFQLSKDWRDRKDIKKAVRQPIAEVFYGPSPTEAQWEEMFETVQLCLKNFEASEIGSYLESFALSTWRVQEKGSMSPWFVFDGIPIYAKYDFAIVEKDQALLFDWKTGNPERESAAIEQLHWYAAFAHYEWGIPYESIRIAPIWLRTGVSKPWEEQRVNLELIERLRTQWRERYDSLKSRIDAVIGEEQDIFEAFPITENRNSCQRCNYRICSQHPKKLETTQTL